MTSDVRLNGAEWYALGAGVRALREQADRQRPPAAWLADEQQRAAADLEALLRRSVVQAEADPPQRLPAPTARRPATPPAPRPSRRPLLGRSDQLLEQVEQLRLHGRRRLPDPLRQALESLASSVSAGVDATRPTTAAAAHRFALALQWRLLRTAPRSRRRPLAGGNALTAEQVSRRAGVSIRHASRLLRQERALHVVGDGTTTQTERRP